MILSFYSYWNFKKHYLLILKISGLLHFLQSHWETKLISRAYIAPCDTQSTSTSQVYIGRKQWRSKRINLVMPCGSAGIYQSVCVCVYVHVCVKVFIRHERVHIKSSHRSALRYNVEQLLLSFHCHCLQYSHADCRENQGPTTTTSEVHLRVIQSSWQPLLSVSISSVLYCHLRVRWNDDACLYPISTRITLKNNLWMYTVRFVMYVNMHKLNDWIEWCLNL